MTRSLVLGTAGHIDHGKTALVRALTGIDTDRLPEEKARGVTIDIGFAHLRTEHEALAIIDVPGHERFIRNMLAGASGIDLALLVVAADDSVMPQTREHLAILQLLNIRHGLVAMTKCDLAGPEWLDLVEADIRELTAGTFLHDAPIIRTSAHTGAGLDALKAAIQSRCAVLRLEQRQEVDEEPFRLAVDRSFTSAGLGTIITGTVWSGSIQIEDELEQLPAQRRVRIRGLQVHGQSVAAVSAGQRAAINLTGVHHSEIERGHELARPRYLVPSSRISVRVRVLPDSPLPIRHRSRVRLHIGTAEVMAQVRLLRGMSVEPGQSGLAYLITADPIVCTARQPFVVRCESPLITLGGGTVLQPTVHVPATARGDEEGARRLQRIESEDPATRVATAIQLRGFSRWHEIDLLREADVTEAQARRCLKQLQDHGILMHLGKTGWRSIVIHAERVAQLRARIVQTVRVLHERSPLAPSIPRAQISQRLSYLDDDLIQALLNHMIESGHLAGDEQAVALEDHKPELNRDQLNLVRKLVAEYESAAFTPPDLDEVSRTLGTTSDRLRPLVTLAVQQNELVHVGGPFYLHASGEQRARAVLGDAFRKSDGLTLSEIRVLLSTTRKYAVPLCEYFDRVGVTKRVGDRRYAGPNL